MHGEFWSVKNRLVMPDVSQYEDIYASNDGRVSACFAILCLFVKSTVNNILLCLKRKNLALHINEAETLFAIRALLQLGNE